MSGNGLSPLYITGVDLNQYFVSNQTGEALANGKLYFYVDSNRTQAKNVFELVQGSGSPPNYTYQPLPNPVTLSAVGTIMDANGNNCALYYYPYDSFGNVQLYYVECYDEFGNLQFTREAWPYLSTTGGGMSGTINSAAQNSVAWYATTGTTISGIAPVNSSVFVSSNTGVPGWTQTLPSAVQVTASSFNNGTGATVKTFLNGLGQWAAPLVNVQVFTANGTFTASAATSYIIVECLGGGGGGGYAAWTANTCAGAGGGAGGYGIYYGAVATGVTVTVGAAGVGGIGASSTAATAGGTSSFGVLISCTGGAGGEGMASSAGDAWASGGAAGVSSSGTVNGGGAPGTGARLAGGIFSSIGEGGSSLYGGGGRGGFVTNGGAATGYGAGGGGASADTVSANGGAGAPGIVIVYEFS